MRRAWARSLCAECRGDSFARRGRFLSSSTAASSKSIARSGRQSPNSSLYLTGLNPFAPPAGASTGRSPVGLQSNPLPQRVPFLDWLLTAGSPSDDLSIEDDDASAKIELLGVSSGVSHALVSYRIWGRSGVVERVLAMGQNATGQLGLGFASQEPTRGLMGPKSFSGDALEDLACTAAGSFVCVRDGEDRTRLFATGSHSRGQLGLGRSPTDDRGAYSQDTSTARSVTLSAQATEVKLANDASALQVATGLEHALVSTSDGDVLATGCNSDGQLGLEDLQDRFAFVPVPLASSLGRSAGGVQKLLAGGDSSGLLAQSGELWTWGNSEYAQCLHGKEIDQIPVPTAVDLSFLPRGAHLVDVALTGPFSLLLDNLGNVYSAGYGALGLGSDTLATLRPTRIPDLEGVSSIRAGFGYAAAVQDHSRLFVWGLDSAHGRLGLGNGMATTAGRTASAGVQVTTPREVALPSRDRHGRRPIITEVSLGKEAMWILAEDPGAGAEA